MRKYLAVLLLCILVSMPCHAKQAQAPPVNVKTEGMQIMWRHMEMRGEMVTKPRLKGRLIIPSVGIDVGLYYVNWDNGQRIANRKDSAGWYHRFLTKHSEVIADHKTQEFKTLPKVEVGDRAYILTMDEIIALTCTWAIDGHNTGDYITDADCHSVIDDAEYVCYTCLKGWRNVRVVGFDSVPGGFAGLFDNDGYLF